jgi:hypothetical protein
MEELNIVLLVLILLGVVFLVYLSLRNNVDFDLRLQNLNKYELPFEKVKNVPLNNLNYRQPQLVVNVKNNKNNYNNLNNEINNHLNDTLEEVIQNAKNHNLNLVDENLESVLVDDGEELNSTNFINNSNTDTMLNN